MIRKFENSDIDGMLLILDLNTPEFFHAMERDLFRTYLESLIEEYFVVEEGNEIIAGGGINYFLEQNKARLSWDMVHPAFQGKGYGGKLVTHRISLLKPNREINRIEVRTSQTAFRFYQKMGFMLEIVEKDYWAKGFDLYQMRY